MTAIELLKHFYYFIFILTLVLVALLLYLFKKQLALYKIQQDFPPLSIITRDTLLSTVITIALIPSTLLCAYFFWKHIGWGYMDIHQHSIYYFIFSILLILIVYDAHFYWSHRLLHTPFFFKHVHHVHHKSRNTTILTFFAVHPVEMILYSASAPLCIFLFPVNPLALMIGQGIHIIYAIYGHSGYEIIPNKGIGRWINTSFCHYNHHQHFNSNFSFYFIFWDRLLGTLGKNYWRDFSAFHQRKTHAKRLQPH